MKRLLIVLILLPFFHAPGYAEGLADRTLDIFDTVQMENGLSREEREIGGEIGADGYNVRAALSRLWRSFALRLKERMHEELGFAAKLLGLVLFCTFSTIIYFNVFISCSYSQHLIQPVSTTARVITRCQDSKAVL